MEYIIRKSIESDAPQIKALFLESFGFIDPEVLYQIKEGCLVAEKNGIILSVGGITANTQDTIFNDGYEVLWTATKKEYRKNGIAVSILRKAISERKDKTKPVYCSCLRVGHKKINMGSVMDRLGFKLLYESEKHVVFPYFKACLNCSHRCEGSCECFEDLCVLDTP